MTKDSAVPTVRLAAGTIENLGLRLGGRACNPECRAGGPSRSRLTTLSWPDAPAFSRATQDSDAG